jgi:hypothetical protein
MSSSAGYEQFEQFLHELQPIAMFMAQNESYREIIRSIIRVTTTDTELLNILNDIALDRRISPGEVLQQAVRNEWLFHHARRAGSHVLLEKTDGSFERVRFPDRGYYG